MKENIEHKVFGYNVLQTATYLKVPAGIVEKWVKEGLLETVSTNPIKIARKSLLETEQMLTNLYKMYPDDCSNLALAAFLHDRDLVESLDIEKALQDIDNGEWVEL